MNELKRQFVNALLVILTAAACVAGYINFQQNFHPEKRYRLPQDGVTWVDRKTDDGKNVVKALYVAPDGQGERAGIKPGDTLLQIESMPIRQAIDVAQAMQRAGLWAQPKYRVVRQGVAFDIKVIIGERTPDNLVLYQYLIGLAYLLTGLYVYFRRGNAPKALHFLGLCLVSFVLSTFHYTGKLNTFDKVIYWGNVAAGIFAPTIFLHFCLSFPEPRRWLRNRGRTALIYLPATALLAVMAAVIAGNLRIGISSIELNWMMDRLSLAYFSFLYLLGSVILHAEYRRSTDAIIRQQLKWLRNGTLLGIVPYTILYVVPYVLGAAPAAYMRWAVLFLPFMPLTWAYAIIRYRLMDVDVIFQQGYVYTLATLAVLGIFYGLFFTFGSATEELSPSAIIALILIATFVFQPIHNWIREILDRYYFYRESYDYRRTLIEFARELSSETDLDRMLDSVADRLKRSLWTHHMAVFLRDDDQGRFRLARVWPDRPELGNGDYLDLSFLPVEATQPYLFFERTKHALDVVTREYPPAVRHSIADLDLTYYLPCSVRGRTIAYLGVSRNEQGDFLSSSDLELLITLSGYVGIAIENARLYSSLQQKVDQYERLKEYSENIVESINVGVLAVDLHDRVESWNSQVEHLTGIPREYAVDRRLNELFPADLCERFNEVKGQTGIHNIYKFCYRPAGLPANALGVAATDGYGNGYGNGTGNGASSAPAARELTLNLAIAPLVSKDMNEIGRLIILDDITDRSELETRLVQADKLSSIGLLAAGVAHEVNTPLAVISTYAQMLAKQVSGDDQKSKLLDKIAKQTFRASEIVNSLLNFSRTSASDFADVQLNRIIEETISLVRHQLDKAGVRVVLELQEGLPHVKGNPGKLQQVFLNLVLNARDAMEGGGEMRIRSASEAGIARIEVTDTGHGIPAENLARIYDPFFTTKAARKGTGLGLSVTYGIVQEHGGSIEVRSEIGHGTTFQLEFPLARKPVAA